MLLFKHAINSLVLGILDGPTLSKAPKQTKSEWKSREFCNSEFCCSTMGFNSSRGVDKPKNRPKSLKRTEWSISNGYAQFFKNRTNRAATGPDDKSIPTDVRTRCRLESARGSAFLRSEQTHRRQQSRFDGCVGDEGKNAIDSALIPHDDRQVTYTHTHTCANGTRISIVRAERKYQRTNKAAPRDSLWVCALATHGWKSISQTFVVAASTVLYERPREHFRSESTAREISASAKLILGVFVAALFA